ncbi:unnamed protein product [Didymodactylos carnosus]|uniref:Reverse transcriptase domain-containing protein n=1 Tax=Didymodactylos carnosus TaxID=1234261 RepID=A0A814U6N8_9BILA|nr:unnamed protein product [Didymodactylos carnosus]CAF1170580.1 unnamed protein product [Didymodactylos carnosus]CAF3699731.1 unnamed protein product [Didymodactylos carnosus]CAF3934303.1 unnamed protein product [Didymodactylos carnosus]
MDFAKRYLECVFETSFEKKVSPGRSVEKFFAELNLILQNLHDTPITIQHQQQIQHQKISYDNLLTTIQLSQSQVINHTISSGRKKNSVRLGKRLKHKLRSTSIILQKTDKSKVFRLVHKPNTALRPIIVGLKHSTIKISKYLGELLRPLFDRISYSTSITSGSQVIKQMHGWSKYNIRQATILCAIDVVDLYTMIPQTEGVLSIKIILDYLDDFLDLYMENINGQLFTTVYYKPSYEL